ncbi:NB-ARC domain-containing disease resistance-like protein [Theobroma cacao]|uniref:NB-ARC domain-containing disease resistance-like protein n=1 Tax=Theobroma cacao TaxID=3641 RepID=A0A061FN70_THECC|nr:NB-ARC domain-containing disease resistance-like protein [Theobroma cacao]
MSLFKQLAFVKQNQTFNFVDLELETIREKIVKHCAGVPLAIRAIGSLLCFKRIKSEWSRVLENITQHGHGTGIESILRLSYDHLPSHLEQCFTYCSLFPNDYEIRKHVLIKLWMAQGFIQSLNRGQSLEDVGHDYFMDLLRDLSFKRQKKMIWAI